MEGGKRDGGREERWREGGGVEEGRRDGGKMEEGWWEGGGTEGGRRDRGREGLVVSLSCGLIIVLTFRVPIVLSSFRVLVWRIVVPCAWDVVVEWGGGVVFAWWWWCRLCVVMV